MMVIRMTVSLLLLLLLLFLLLLLLFCTSKTYIINIYHSRIVNMPLFLFQEMIYISF